VLESPAMHWLRIPVPSANVVEPCRVTIASENPSVKLYRSSEPSLVVQAPPLAITPGMAGFISTINLQVPFAGGEKFLNTISATLLTSMQKSFAVAISGASSKTAATRADAQCWRGAKNEAAPRYYYRTFVAANRVLPRSKLDPPEGRFKAQELISLTKTNGSGKGRVVAYWHLDHGTEIVVVENYPNTPECHVPYPTLDIYKFPPDPTVFVVGGFAAPGLLD
jgi:hypothetical protein